jgi:hypothetical protein
VLLALADEVIEVSINFARTLLHVLTAAPGTTRRMNSVPTMSEIWGQADPQPTPNRRE